MIVRDQNTHMYLTREEVARVRERMAEAGVKNLSAFLRKMALDGYIIKLDLDELSEMIRLLRISSNNLNQIAKKVNAGGSIYGAEIAEMQARQDEIWELAKEILARLSSIQ
ncbi:MAG: plasmid mobilization relaxosome protein MobC [Oscillospiraceae bacterium]|nr:plasmid mobilization relaxosome protein MobC [Oscillospiraceae bacterium]